MMITWISWMAIHARFLMDVNGASFRDEFMNTDGAVLAKAGMKPVSRARAELAEPMKSAIPGASWVGLVWGECRGIEGVKR